MSILWVPYRARLSLRVITVPSKLSKKYTQWQVYDFGEVLFELKTIELQGSIIIIPRLSPARRSEKYFHRTHLLV